VRVPFAARAARPSIVACAAAVAIVVAGCGSSSASKPGISVASANNNGAYVTAGGITYQLQISRELNQYGPEDSEYVKGLPAGTTQPGPTQLWYGVFLWAKNQTDRTLTTTDNFEIVDTQGNVYRPEKLDANVDPFAWTAQTLPPSGTEPAPNTPASEGPTQGGILLFKLSSSAYANRPLTLYILGASGQKQASISLDL